MTDVAVNAGDTAQAAPAADTPDVPVTVTPPTLPTEQAADWRQSLPEDIRGNPSLAKFTSVDALAKSYVNASQMIGRDKVPIPKDGESWDDFYKAAGRPDDPKEYAFKAPEGLPEGFEYVQETADAFRAVAHATGQSNKQAQELHDWFVESAAAAHVAGQVDPEIVYGESLGALSKDWGNATGQRLQRAQSTALNFGGQEFVEMLEETGMGNNTMFIKFLDKVGEATSGDKGLVGTALTEHTPAEIQIQIADFEAQHIKALTDKMHPENALRAQQRMALYEKMYPGKAA